QIRCYNEDKTLFIDHAARQNLELTQTIRTRDKKGTLLWVLDRTRTAMGKRLLRQYLEQPLATVPKILRRQRAVDELFRDTVRRGDLMEALSGVYDLQRLMTKVVYGTVGPRELLSLAATAGSLPEIERIISGFGSPMLKDLHRQLDVLADIKDLIDRAIDPECPVSLKDGGVIRKGFHAERDELYEIRTNARGFLTGIETRERERTGIKNLKVGYNRVFGYYIEVTRSFLEQVPEDYIRKQTLVGGERFITQELKDLETKVLYATEKLVALEAQLFDEVRQRIQNRIAAIERTASVCAQLDVFCSLAQVAAENGYVCPDITLNGTIRITAGRHPVVEAISTETPFIPNDTLLDGSCNRIAVITGPNLAGKSTYMRQVALITIMAQMGSFVPAQSAEISIVDKVFSRVGASDDLSAGQSTFMVEMTEVADILKNATPSSLVILDEIGRGTSTFDGMSIAKAVVEHIITDRTLGCKTLFATHYHELTELENEYTGIVNYSVAVKKRGEDIIFLRKIVKGGADGSYGIEVAKLAGVPQKVIRRARAILKELESAAPAAPVTAAQDEQISLTAETDSQVLKRLRQADLDSMTPREALEFLYDLRKDMID
ncbi:MAG: DNA mismatch repair protein MutS, partial [Oscillospiraceae bacterium]|nr:DNA mismatch repair protein MutS [Oscillospiraceae bacterium]